MGYASDLAQQALHRVRMTYPVLNNNHTQHEKWRKLHSKTAHQLLTKHFITNYSKYVFRRRV